MATPTRSLPQQMAALDRANEIRTFRANLKKDIKAGKIAILKLLLDPPKEIETMKLFDFLMAVPKFGRVKTNKVLTTCRISMSKTIGGLSDRQRDEIVTLLNRR